MSDVSKILSAIEQGDPSAADQLLPLVYNELRRLASDRLARESPGQTLQPTALVHEAYIRLVDKDSPVTWDSRGHFFLAAAAESMRHILVDRARRKTEAERGGDRQRVEVENDHLAIRDGSSQLVALDAALNRLRREDPPKPVAKLRHFAGLSLQEAARALGVSRLTASRNWAYAKAWLYGALEDAGEVRGLPALLK